LNNIGLLRVAGNSFGMRKKSAHTSLKISGIGHFPDAFARLARIPRTVD